MILVALGANLPDKAGRPPIETLEDTLRSFERDGVAVVGRSRWYRAPPYPPSDQPDYINAVVRIETERKPLELLLYCHRLEAEAGRVRRQVGAARPLDLDLLDIDGRVRGTAPILPHPRLHERAFVLLPLVDVAPDWRHPVSRRPVAALIAALPAGHGVRPLD